MEDYHKRITNVAVAILREYRELFGKQLPDQGALDHKTLEEQKRQLDYELNTSGKYFAFKEQLKVTSPLCFLPSYLSRSDSFSMRSCCSMVVTQDDVWCSRILSCHLELLQWALRGQDSPLMEQAPSCFGPTPREHFLSMGATHIHLPHAHNLRKAKLAALTFPVCPSRERRFIPLSCSATLFLETPSLS